jgi:hypothetical protein
MSRRAWVYRDEVVAPVISVRMEDLERLAPAAHLRIPEKVALRRLEEILRSLEKAMDEIPAPGVSRDQVESFRAHVRKMKARLVGA